MFTEKFTDVMEKYAGTLSHEARWIHGTHKYDDYTYTVRAEFPEENRAKEITFHLGVPENGRVRHTATLVERALEGNQAVSQRSARGLSYPKAMQEIASYRVPRSPRRRR